MSSAAPTKHINLPNVQAASYEFGKAAGHLANQIEKVSKDKRVQDGLQNIKQNGMERYTQETGRNASIDGSILKYTAMGVAGAVAIASAPAVIIGAAISTTVVAVAASQVNKATEAFSEATGRDPENDKKLVSEIASESKVAASVSGSALKHGYQSVRTPQSN